MPANTPFSDIIIVAADSPVEMDLKVKFYITQGYKVTAMPTRFEDITIDLEAMGKSVIQLPKAIAAVAILLRNDAV